MAEFIAVVNDTDAKNGGKSYALKITGNNHAQMLGKRIGDVVDGLFVGLLSTSKLPSRIPSSKQEVQPTAVSTYFFEVRCTSHSKFHNIKSSKQPLTSNRFLYRERVPTIGFKLDK